MNLVVELDANGLLPDKYAKFAPEEFRQAGVPVLNFPIKIEDVPAETKTLGITLIDYDAVPVGGFPWIHWLAANLPVADVQEDLAHSSVQYTHGTNSDWHNEKNSPVITQSYIGPMPPDQTHDYTLSVFALNEELPLSDGFFLNEFKRAIAGHILAEATLELPARSE